jgi:hypothetical protein
VRARHLSTRPPCPYLLRPLPCPLLCHCHLCRTTGNSKAV